ncbi:TPA: hypothetical protein J1047_004646 [Escherichia coli]|nr:hypothetical protein [Escherichia coli]
MSKINYQALREAAKNATKGSYNYADEVNAALAAAGIRIKGEDHGNKTRR